MIGASVAALAAATCRPRFGQHPPAGQPVTWSATAMARAIRLRQISSSELVKLHLERIAAINPNLNAVVHFGAKSAMAHARRADQAVTSGEPLGPLHGVPMTIKDSLDTADLVTTAGTSGRAQFTPARDAIVVARLRASGAILLGKTNTPEFTLDYETSNAVYGRTNNPYDFNRTPAGSSGGAAAAVASGAAAFDIGSDTGGSIRIPAHFCGIAGLKPSATRVPRTGHIIPFGGPIDGWTQLGPLARHVEDLRLLLSVIAGADWVDPSVVDMPLGDDRVPIQGLRVAYFTDNAVDPVTPETREAVQRTVTGLADAGAIVEEAKPQGFEDSQNFWPSVGLGDRAAWIRRLFDESRSVPLPADFESWQKSLRPSSGEELHAAITAMHAYQSRMLSFMQTRDVIICPVESTGAVLHGQFNTRKFVGTYALPFNITGQPVVVVRAGTSADGMPIGVQVVARRWREDVALAVAGQIEAAHGGWKPAPL
jgi:amidase